MNINKNVFTDTEEKMRNISLEELVRNCIMGYIRGRGFDSDIVKKRYKAALLENIYCSDYNAIRTLDELTSRIMNDYKAVYEPYLKGIYLDDAENAAEQLDMDIRTVLTVFGMVYCSCVNEFARLEADYIEHVLCLSDDDKNFHGCVIFTQNGLMIDTLKGVVTTLAANCGDFVYKIPAYALQEFLVCIGYPHYTGMHNIDIPEEEIICEDPDIDFSGVELPEYDNSWAVELHKTVTGVA